MNNERFLSFQADTNTSFLRAARGGELGKLVEFLETGQILDINASNAVSFVFDFYSDFKSVT